MGITNGSPADIQIRAITFKTDGTRVYIAQRDHGKVIQYDLSTPWDISSATNQVESNAFTGEENNLRNIQFSSDGTFMYLGGSGGDDINKYRLPTAWDVSTIIHVTSYSISSQTVEMRGFKFTANFTKLYVTGDTANSGTGTNVVYEYNLACAGTITCDPINDKDITAIIEANVELSKRIIKNNTLPIFHRIEWLRRHKNKDNLSNLNAEINFNTTTQLDNPLLNYWITKLPDKIVSINEEVKNGQYITVGRKDINNNNLNTVSYTHLTLPTNREV